MLEKLSEGLKDALRKLTGAGYIDKNVLDELARDIQKTLLASDVDVKLASELTERIKDRALNEKPPTGMTAKEHVTKIVYDYLYREYHSHFTDIFGYIPEIIDFIDDFNKAE